MKYSARFGEGASSRSRSVEIASAPGEGERVFVTFDAKDAKDGKDGAEGVISAWDVVPTPSGGYSIVGPSGRHAEATVHRDADGAMRIYVAGELFRFEFLDDLTARALAATGAHKGKKKGDLRAAIPGRVLRISVAVGDTVVIGQPLVVLEAMKMENDVRSSRDGVVKSIEVKPGEAVSAGTVLIKFEA